MAHYKILTSFQVCDHLVGDVDTIIGAGGAE